MNTRSQQKPKSHSKIFVLLFVIVSVALCIFLSARGRFEPSASSQTVSLILSPFQKITSWFGSRFSVAYSAIQELSTLHEENERLRAEVEQLRAENLQAVEFAAENDRLRAMVGYQQSATQFDLVAARVIGYESQAWSHMITIDRGTRHGIKDQMAVVTPSGLVGHVTEAGFDSSKVQLLIDSRSSVGAMIQRPTSRVVGIVEGDPSNPTKPRMVNIPKDSDMNEGDLVITSGFGGVYPKGIIIGTIEEIHPDTGGLLKYGLINTSVDFQRLEDVAVIVESREAPPIPIQPTDNQIIAPTQPIQPVQPSQPAQPAPSDDGGAQ